MFFFLTSSRFFLLCHPHSKVFVTLCEHRRKYLILGGLAILCWKGIIPVHRMDSGLHSECLTLQFCCHEFEAACQTKAGCRRLGVY